MDDIYTIDQIKEAFLGLFSFSGLHADERIQIRWEDFKLVLETQGKQGGVSVDRVLINDRVP